MAFDLAESGVDEGKVLEALPEDVVASLEVRDAWRQEMASTSPALEFLVSHLALWPPGGVVRVAFLGGGADLHRDIAEATEQITDACNLSLDFGFDAATGEFRRWRETDTAYAAEIRVSFDQPGFWSLLGTDSNDPTVGPPSGPIGGRPGQRSLNLGGFVQRRPPDWKGTVRHEFMHAVAFKHEHQNMRGPCEDQFRWDDDEGYVPTQDVRGRFIPDAAGRRPGIYTYLAGPPNNWPRAKVDHNLRTQDTPDTVAGSFDAASVMLYRFEPFFYRSHPSPCSPTTDGIDVSPRDREGLQLLYSDVSEALDDIVKRGAAALAELDARVAIGRESTDESSPAAGSPYQERSVELINSTLEGIRR
jgi:hypothetical protein